MKPYLGAGKWQKEEGSREKSQKRSRENDDNEEGSRDRDRASP